MPNPRMIRRYQPPVAPPPVGIEDSNAPLFGGELFDCDRCGVTYHKVDLTMVEGFLLCNECLDWPGHTQVEATA